MNIIHTLATNVHSMTMPELITLLTTLVTLFVVAEHLLNAT